VCVCVVYVRTYVYMYVYVYVSLGTDKDVTHYMTDLSSQQRECPMTNRKAIVLTKTKRAQCQDGPTD